MLSPVYPSPYTLTPQTLSAFQAVQAGLGQPGCIFSRGRNPVGLIQADAILDAGISGERDPLSTLAALADVYREDWIAYGNVEGVRKVHSFNPFEADVNQRVVEAAFEHGSVAPPIAQHFRHSGLCGEAVSGFLTAQRPQRVDTFLTGQLARRIESAFGILGLYSAHENFVFDGVHLGALLLFVAEHCNWKIVLQAQLNENIQLYCQQFFERSRPLYISSHFAFVHTMMLHPYDIFYHDIFHLLELSSVYSPLSEGSVRYEKQVALIQMVLARLEQAGKKDLYERDVFPGGSLLLDLAEGQRLETATRFASDPESEELANQIEDEAARLGILF